MDRWGIRVEVKITNKLIITDMPQEFGWQVEDRLSFPNPAFLEAERMGRWTGNIPEVLRFYKQDGDSLVLPRGFVRQLLGMAKREGIRYRIEDRRRVLSEVDFGFNGRLRPFQKEAVEKILSRDFGTLSAPTGSGKTVMALSAIATRKQPALWVVHTRELQNQTIERIEAFLGIPSNEIGIIGNGKKTVGEKITVALVQSLYKCAHEVTEQVGHLIVDECHRAPSRTFTEAVTAFDSKFMLGLSATPWRRDKLSKLIFWCLGDVVHEIKKVELVETGDVLRADVVMRNTDFQPFSDPQTEYTTMLSELTEDAERNLLIAEDVVNEARNGSGVCLVLSDRKAHCEALQSVLKGFRVKAELLTGDLNNGERQRVVEDLNAGKVKVLIATGQLIGEGFDCAELSTLFLATPIKFDGRLLQYLGRVLRPAPGKDRAKVFDYVDVHVPVLVASSVSRKRLYRLERKAA